MADLNPEEQKQAIEKFIRENQEKFIFYKTIQSAFPVCDGATLSKWVKNLYGEKPSEFFTNRGVIVRGDKIKDFTLWILDMLKEKYKSRTPAADFDTLIHDNPGLAVDDLTYSLEKPYANVSSLRLIDDGILQDPFQSNQSVKDFIENFTKSRRGYSPYLSLVELRSRIVFYLPQPFYGKEGLARRLFDRFPAIFGCTAEEYFVDHKMLISPEEAAKAAKKDLRILAKEYLDPESRVTMLMYVIHQAKNQSYSPGQLMQYYLYEAEKKGLSEKTDAEEYVKQVFIDAGIVKGEMSEEAAKAWAKEAAAKEAKKQEEAAKAAKLAQLTKTDLYTDPSKIDIDALWLAVGFRDDKNYPEDKTHTVVLNGKQFRIIIGLKRTLKRLNPNIIGYAAEKEYKTMLSREEVRAKIEEEDPNWHTDAADYATAQFICKNRLSDDEILRRFSFLKTVGIRLSDQDTLEALADFAPKKKDGSFDRRSTLRIASSMVAMESNIVYEIVGHAKDDDLLSVTFEAEHVNPSNLEKTQNDFVSYYWDLIVKKT